MQLSEYAKFNALATLSGDWERSGKASVTQSASSIHITWAGEYAAGGKGGYVYKKAIKLSNQQTISIRATLGDRYTGMILYIHYKKEDQNAYTLLKTLDGSIDGKNIIYDATFPVSGNINIMLSYGVSGYSCPIDINITKFTIE